MERKKKIYKWKIRLRLQVKIYVYGLEPSIRKLRLTIMIAVCCYFLDKVACAMICHN